ncbi:MAG: hypothetical protein ACSLE6_16390 [Mycobacterium sp.]
MHPHSGMASQSHAALPTAADSSSDLTRVLTGLLLVLVGIGAIAGGIMAFTAGLPALAFAIALVAGAFLARIGC